MKRIYLFLLLSFAVFAQTNLVRVPTSTVGGSGAKCQLRGVAGTRTAAIDSINGVYNNPYFEFTVTTSGRYDLYYDSNGTTGGLSYSKQTDWSGTYGRWIDGMIDAERALTLQETADTDNDGKVETAGLEDSVITSVKLAGNQVKTVHLQNSIVTNAKIASDAVDSSKVGAGTLGRTDLVDSLINKAKLTTAINEELDNAHVKYNAFRETVSFAGEVFNGASLADSGITIPTSSTGQSSYRTAEFSVSSAVTNIASRLVGKTLTFTVYLNVTNAFQDDCNFTPRLTVKRTSGTASNQHSGTTAGYVPTDSTLFWFKYNYTVQAADTAYLVTFQISTATSVTRDITLKYRSIEFEVTAPNTYATNALTTKEIIDRELYTVNNTITDIQGDVSDNLLYVKYMDANTSFSGQALNGAVLTDSGFYIPTSNTGTTTYRYPILKMTEGDRADRLLGKRIRLKVFAEVTAAFTTYLSGANSIKLDGLRNGGVVTGLALAASKGYANTDSTLYYYTTDYIVQSGDEQLYPTLQISNSNSLGTQIDFTIVNAEYAVLYDSTRGLTPNQGTMDEAITVAINANNELGIVRNIIKVKQDFTGDYSTIDSALTAITGATATNPYEIRVYPGIYEEYYVTMKAHCYLRGMGGSPEDVWMKGYQPTGTSLANVALKSTLEFDVTGGLENMKFTAQNMRYVIHSETAASTDSTIVQTVDNCIFEHFGNQEIIDSVGTTTGVWLSTNAWGCGMTGGEEIYVKNSLFKSVSTPFSFHTKAAASVYHPIYVEMDNCRIVSTFKHPIAAGNGPAFSIQALGSEQPDKFVLRNTSINGWIESTDTPWSAGIFSENPRHDEIRIHGGGNTPAYYKPNFQGRVLRISSTDSTASSDVLIGGTNADTLFGATIDTSDGAAGFAAWAQGTVDVSHYAGGTAAADSAHFLSKRLGDCTSVNKSFTVAVDGGGTQTVTFDQNYTGLTTAQIVDSINAQLSGAVASLYNPSQLSFPNFGDEYIEMKNVSATAILRGMAVADTLNYVGARRMTSSDDIYDFVGVAMQDIKPDETGWIRKVGYVAVDPTFQGTIAKQWTYTATANGTNYGIDPAHPGYFKASETPTLLRGKTTGIARLIK